MFFPSISYANHGPGTTAGGATTQSGETLKQGSFIFSLDNSYTNYQSLSRQQIIERASDAGEFDALSDAFLTNLTTAFGITDDFQIEASIGWYSGRSFIDARKEETDNHSKVGFLSELGSNDVNLATGNPEGLTDLALRGKYRLMKGIAGHLSIIAGTILPIGNDSEKLNDGEELEPSSQPGSGRYGAIGGVAYSRYLLPTTTIDLSSKYTYRIERDSFKIGNRIDTGIAFAYRLQELNENLAQLSIFLELLHQYIGKDEEEGEKNINSGSNTLFISPGVKVNIGSNVGMVVAPSFPIYQNLSGEQLETDFRFLSQLFYKF